jgi:hypothetical protein
MAQLIRRVERGEIITAEMWNLAVDAINELLQSGQTSGIKIASVEPAGTTAEPLRIGTLLQITGQSFGYSVGQTSVAFDGGFGSVVVPRDTLLTGSSDTRLLLMVPPLPGLTQSGAGVTMRVGNGVAEDVRSVFVMPVVINLQGDVFVSWRSDTPNPSPNPLVAGQTADFAYRLTTGTNLPASFDLSADILHATAALPPDLVGSLQFLDPRNQNQPIAGRRLDLGKTDTREVTVRMPAVPPSFANQSFTLRVGAAAGGVAGSDSRTFPVGTAIAPSDPSIGLQQTDAAVISTTGSNEPPGENGQLDGTNIRLNVDWQMIVVFNVNFTQAGVYDLTIQPSSGPLNGWVLQLVNTPPSITVGANGLQRFVQFGVTRLAGAEANGRIIFRVKRRDAETDQTKEYSVQFLQ